MVHGCVDSGMGCNDAGGVERAMGSVGRVLYYSISPYNFKWNNSLIQPYYLVYLFYNPNFVYIFSIYPIIVLKIDDKCI